MLAISKILDNTNYGVRKRSRIEGLPYVCHLTCIFKHFKVSFYGYAKEFVKSF